MRGWLDMPSRVFWWVLGVGVLVRLAGAASGIEITADTVSYQISALALMSELHPGFTLENSGPYPVFIVPELLQHNASDFLIERTPGFPLLMMGTLLLQAGWQEVVTTDGLYRLLVLFNSLMGLGSALLCAELGWQLFRRADLALVAGWLAACSPNLLGSEHVVLSEPLYTASLMLTVLIAHRLLAAGPPRAGGLLLLGLLSGWLMWIKPIGLAVILALGGFLWLHRVRRGLACYLAPVALMIALWMGFQAQVHGGFIGYTAGGGMNQLYKVINFMDLASPRHAAFKAELRAFAETVPPENAYMAVNAVHARHLQAEAAKPPADRRPIWQIYREDDLRARAIATEALLAHPARYLQVSLQQVARTWLDPTQWDRHLLYWSPVFLLGLLGIAVQLREGSRVACLPLLVIAAHALLYAVLTWGDPRYRIPLEPLFILFAVAAGRRLLEAHRQARQ